MAATKKPNKILFVMIAIILLVYLYNYLPMFSGSKETAFSNQDLPEVETITQTSSASLEEEALALLVDPFSLRIPVRKAGAATGAIKTRSYLPSASSLVLGGTWIYGEVKYALIGDDSVGEGDNVDGWVVKEIKTNQVVLQKGGQRKTLKLEE